MWIILLSTLATAGTVQVVGSSVDGGAWAVRYVETAGQGLDGGCNYPALKDGRRPTYVKLFLCTTSAGCPSLNGQGWVVYDRACTDDASALTSLDAAKQGFVERGVTLGLHGDSLPRNGDAWTLSKGNMSAVGLASEVQLTASTSKEGWRVVASDGDNAVTVWGGKMRPTLMHLLPDRSVLVFTGEGTDVQRIPLKRIAARLVNDRGFEFYKRKLYPMALVAFQRSTVIDPGFGQGAFNWACTEALLGNTDMALTALGKAIAADADVFKAKARRDTDLTSIRQDPRFVALVE